MRLREVLSAAAVMTLVALCPVSSAAALGVDSRSEELFPPATKAPRSASGEKIPDHYVVVFKSSVKRPGDLARSRTEELDGDLGFVYWSAIKGFSAELSPAAVEDLRDDPRVKYVTPDRRVELFAQTIPRGISRISATSNATADIDGVDDARVNVDVAVIDSGVDSAHPDLNVFKRTDCGQPGTPVVCVDNTGTDTNGHGTHVAGTLAAIDNNEGVVGVAPGARIWAVKVMNAGGEIPESSLIAGINWITTRASEIEVANASLGCFCNLPAVEEAVSAAVDAGVVFVVAAGNDGGPAALATPAKNPDVITVSALTDYDGNAGGEAAALATGQSLKNHCAQPGPGTSTYGSDDTTALFSNYGSAVELAAPGTCILSTVPTGSSFVSDALEGADYGLISGTSMASPHVAGAAALIASKSNPENQADTETIRQQLIDEGSQHWTDVVDWGRWEWQNDEVQEPLLDLAALATAVYTNQATGRNLTGATVRGGLNPNGVASTYYFEYGETTSYGSKSPGSPVAAGSGTKDLAVNQTLSGLKKGSVYHYRLVVERGGQKLYGADRSFTTISPALTEPATGVDPHRLRFEGNVDSSGLAATYQFEYGLTTGYGSKVPSSPASLPAGTKAVDVAQRVEGLRSDETYHYRLVVTIGGETFYGADETVTTTTSGFRAGKYPALVSERDALSQFVYNPNAWRMFNGKDYECLGSPVTGEVTGRSETLILTPGLGDCGGGLSVEPKGCKFEIHLGEDVGETPGELFLGSADVVPPGCGPLRIEPPPAWCEYIDIPSQTGWQAAVSNTVVDGVPMLWVGIATESLKYNQKGRACDTGSFEDGYYSAGWRVKATAGGKPVGLYATDHFDVAKTGSASASDGKTATLHGEVATEGRAAVYVFEYGPTTAYGKESEVGLLPMGSESPAAVSKTLTGLEPGTTYHYRLAVVHDEVENGELAFGNDETFTTPDFRPAVTTEPAAFVRGGGAVLQGTIDPEGRSTTYQFEYGTTTSYGSKAPASPAAAGSGNDPTAVGQRIEGLAPETVYHYRLVATNSEGTRYGADRTLEIHEPRIEANSYPASLSGQQIGGSPLTFTLKPMQMGQGHPTVSCSGATLSGTLTGPAASVSLVPAFSGCTAFGLSGTIATNGCSFESHPAAAWGGLRFEGPLDVDCPSGKSIAITTTTCDVRFGPQSSLQEVELADETVGQEKGWSFRPDVANLAFNVVKDGIGCPLSGTGEFQGATLTGAANVSASSGGQPLATYLSGEEEDREPHAPRFEAQDHPVSLAGDQTSGDPLILRFKPHLVSGAAVTLACDSVALAGGLSAAATSIGLTPTFASCLAFGLNGTVSPNGCSLVPGVAAGGPPFGGQLAIDCPEGKQIVIAAATCEVRIGSQGSLGSVAYDGEMRSGREAVRASFAVGGLKYSVVKDGIGCPLSGTGTWESGELSGSASIWALDGAAPVGVRVSD